MLGNWVKQATATTGTGTITLGSAETGFIAFGDQFADGDIVYYTIEDGNNRESGIGTYTAAGTTLARTTVIETLVSGTFDNTAPTAISLSGSAVVSCSATAQVTIGSAWDQLASATTSIAIPDNYITYGQNLTFGTADLLRYFPARLDRFTKMSTLAWKVETADGTTTNLRFGIYSNTSGLPDTLLVDSGDQSASAGTTGHKTHALASAVYLDPGDYWFALVSDSTTLGIAGPPAADKSGGITPIKTSDNERRSHITESGVTGALPASAGTLALATGTNQPMFGWQP